MDELPYICPEHPHAQIEESYDVKKYVYNGYPRGTGIKSNYKWACAECGRELSAPRKEEQSHG